MQRNSKPATAKLVPESLCKASTLMATLCGMLYRLGMLPNSLLRYRRYQHINHEKRLRRAMSK
jgi:hypothetical protein